MEMDVWYGLLIEEMADLEDERPPCPQAPDDAIVPEANGTGLSEGDACGGGR